MNSILISGATGLIGKKLSEELIRGGKEISVLSRNEKKAREILPAAKECVKWDYRSTNDYKNVFQLKDAVIHLAGANVAGKRWTDSYKKEIRDSRVLSTKSIVDTIEKLEQKPKVFIHASAIGIYGEQGENTATEDTGVGNDFLAEVCDEWETEAKRVDDLGVRRVTLRFGVVLDKNGGALGKMIPPFKFFVGGHIGNGEQWFSWIHIDDVVNVIIKAIDDESYNGEYNLTAPNPVRMRKFAKTLGKVLHRPSIFPVPAFILKLIMGEAADSILASQKVLPEKLMKEGYSFQFSNLESALQNILQNK